MISTTIFPGRYVQGEGAIKRVGTEAARFGEKALLLADPFVYDTLLPGFKADVENAVSTTFVRFGGECSDEEIAEIVAKYPETNVVIGVGGGKTLDTAKATAYKLKVPVIVAPTIASTDAPCSALSVIYTPTGEFKRYLILPTNPNAVILDTAFVASAPARFLAAGIGDALATWFEAESCRVNFAGNMTGDVGSMTAYALARLCYDTINEYGVAAMVSAEAGVVTPALERVAEANTLLSGLGFESGGLGAAHAIHNGLTNLEPTHDYWHGEKVAIGVLAGLFLTDKAPALIDEVYSFCESVGLPTTLADIGLENVTDADLMIAAKGATAEGETIHNEPRPVTAETVFAALKAADGEGRRRKAL